MSERPHILVIAGTVYENNSAHTVMRPTYIDLIRSHDMDVRVVSGLDSAQVWREAYEESDGVWLTGGQDYDPATYNEKPHPKLGTLDRKRDRRELELIGWIIVDGMPTLATCRGAQGVAIATGGKLIQHLSKTDIDHGNGQQGYENLINRQHVVYILPGTLAGDIYTSDEVDIPSNHHQAIDPKQPGVLRVSGKAADGVGEFWELPESYRQFLFASQGHNEVAGGEPVVAAFANAVYVARK